jgi:hypothetical protein
VLLVGYTEVWAQIDLDERIIAKSLIDALGIDRWL